MKTLFVYAHPNHQSLCHDLWQSAVAAATSQGSEVHSLDLHAMNFNPVLEYNSQKRRRDMYLEPEMEEHRQWIRWADRIVLIYPIYWGRPPAMLLGWIDRLFAANFAFKDENKNFPKPLLVGKEAVCISTMKGPTFYPLFWLGNAHKILMKRALFGYVGIKKVKFFEFGGAEKPNGPQKKMLAKVSQWFAKA